MPNFATDDRLMKLIDLHYEGAQASPHATAYGAGWYASKSGLERDVCPHSNDYQLDLDCYDKAFYVRLYIHWNYGYDAYLRWSKPPVNVVSESSDNGTE